MSEQLTRLRSELLALPANDRFSITRDLLISLDDVEFQDDETALEAELERRARLIEDGAERGTPIEEVFERIRKKLA